MFYKVSTETINNHDVQQLGLVTAQITYGTNFIRDFFSRFFDFFGGSTNLFAGYVQDSEQNLLEQLEQAARQKNGNALLNIRFETVAIPKTKLIVFRAYATAAFVRRK